MHAGITVKPNDIIPEITHSASRPGFVLVKGESEKVVEQLAEKYIEELSKLIELTDA